MSNFKTIREKIPEKLKGNFCPLPFSSVQLNPLGYMGICPKSAGSFKIPGADVKEKWMSKELEDLRAQFLRGEKPSECFRCWTEEEAGFESLRQNALGYDNNYLDFDFEDISSGKYKDGPRTMVIQSTNFCNFSCRTCHAMDSSGFNREGEHYAEKYGESENRYRNMERKLTGQSKNYHFPEDQMASAVEISGRLKKLDFYGGETLINPSHVKILKGLIEKGFAKEISLLYTTNGSMYPEDLEQIWTEFKSVTISFSIDGGSRQFSYVRHPGKWDVLLGNVQKFKNLRKRLGEKLKLCASITVSLLNVYDLAEIHGEIIEHVTDDISHHIAINPAYYSPRNLPEELKPIVIKHLQASSYPKECQAVVNYIEQNQCEEVEFKNFVVWTNRKDLYRQQKFQQVFSDYYAVLKTHFEAFSNDHYLYSSSSGSSDTGVNQNTIESKLPSDLVDSFCPLPFSSFRLNNLNHSGVCSKTFSKLKLSGKTVGEQWRSQELESLRDEFLKGNKPKLCAQCWNDEENGITSQRQLALAWNDDYLKFSFKDVTEKKYLQGPRELWMRGSNRSNIAGRTAHAFTSDAFAEEGLFYANFYGDKRNIYRQFPLGEITKDVLATNSEEEFFARLEEASRLDRIDFFGESLLSKAHVTLLKQFIERGEAQNIELSYSTSGTEIFQEAEELWPHFKAVNLTFLIEAVKDQYSYLHYPADWDKLCVGFEHYRNLALGGNIKIHNRATVLVSALNIFNLDEIYRQISLNFTQKIHLQDIDYPPYYSPGIFPEEIKTVIINRLRESDHAAQFSDVIKSVERSTYSEKMLRKFIIWTMRMDHYRQQSFRSFQPELYELLAPHFEKYSENKFFYSSLLKRIQSFFKAK